MKVDPRIALGLNLIALALISIQMHVFTAESLAALVMTTFGMVASLLAETKPSSPAAPPPAPPPCALDRCPLRSLPGGREPAAAGDRPPDGPADRS